MNMPEQKSPYKSLRYFIVSLILLVLLACILPFFLKGPGNKRLISPDKIKLPEINFLIKHSRDTRPLVQSQKNAPGIKLKKIYKWEDKEGVLHFADYPNPDGPSQLMAVTADKPEEKGSHPASDGLPDIMGENGDDDPPTLSFPMTLSPDRVKKLKQDAQTIRQDLGNRFDEMGKRIDK